jgi:hypothetical protein
MSFSCRFCPKNWKGGVLPPPQQPFGPYDQNPSLDSVQWLCHSGNSMDSVSQWELDGLRWKLCLTSNHQCYWGLLCVCSVWRKKKFQFDSTTLRPNKLVFQLYFEEGNPQHVWNPWCSYHMSGNLTTRPHQWPPLIDDIKWGNSNVRHGTGAYWKMVARVVLLNQLSWIIHLES